MAVTTWAGAIGDPRVAIHWLLVLTSGGGIAARYADDNLDIEGTHYVGALVVETAPRITADPYACKVSSQGATVSILPIADDMADTTPARPYDLEETAGTSFLKMGAKLYRWAEGTPESERDLLLDGYVEEVRLDTGGELTLTLVDASVKYDRKFPRYTLDKDVFDDPYEDDLGMGYALLYGTFVRVPCPVNDTSNNRAILAEGTAASVTQAYLDDGGVGGESLVTGLTDARGVSYCRVNLGEAITNQEVTVSGTGYNDDADGTYGGTASALLTHPADQLHHMARTYAEVPSDLVDAASFIALRNETAGYVGAIQVLSDDKTTFFGVCDDVARYLRACIFFERGLLTARRIDLARPPSLSLLDEVTIREVTSVDWGDKAQLVSSLKLCYNWGWRKKRKMLDFKSSILLDADNYAAFAQNLAFVGVSEEEIETRMISDDTTAESAINSLAEMRSKVRKECEIVAGRDAHDVRLFDVVEVTTRMVPSATGAGWTDKAFLVVGISYGLDTDVLQLMEV